jgi:hypothetical protein
LITHLFLLPIIASGQDMSAYSVYATAVAEIQNIATIVRTVSSERVENLLWSDSTRPSVRVLADGSLRTGDSTFRATLSADGKTLLELHIQGERRRPSSFKANADTALTSDMCEEIALKIIGSRLPPTLKPWCFSKSRTDTDEPWFRIGVSREGIPLLYSVYTVNIDRWSGMPVYAVLPSNVPSTVDEAAMRAGMSPQAGHARAVAVYASVDPFPVAKVMMSGFVLVTGRDLSYLAPTSDLVKRNLKPPRLMLVYHLNVNGYTADGRGPTAYRDVFLNALTDPGTLPATDAFTTFRLRRRSCP